MSLFGLGKALVGSVVNPVSRVARTSVQLVTMDDRAVDSLENIIPGTVEDVETIASELEKVLKKIKINNR